MNDDDSTKENKIHHVFSFEDFKQNNNIKNIANNIDNNEQLNLIEKDSNDHSKSPNKKNEKVSYMYERKLTMNSKKMLSIRFLIIILILIFIPLQNIASNSLTSYEKNNLFYHIQDIITNETLSNDFPKTFFNIFNYFLDKDFICGVSCLLYIILHPFIALKLIYSVCILFYGIIFVKCFYQSRRPLWEEGISKNDEDITRCETSFSNPSGSLFIINFYYMYSIFCIKDFYNKNHELKLATKIVLFIIYIVISLLIYFYLLIYRLNFLHEIIFTSVISLAIVCLLMEINSKIHKKFYNATKNIFKVRKNKMKSFIFCFGLMFIAILLYNFITIKNTLVTVEKKLSINKACSQNQREELGLKSTFNDIPFLFCMMGAFWGACLTIENNPGIWWYQPFIFDEYEIFKFHGKHSIIYNEEKTPLSEILLLVLKSFIMLIVFILLLFAYSQIPFISFEFNLLISCIKYFSINFICTGILPIIFGFFKINKKIDDFDIKDDNSNDYIYKIYDLNKKNKNLFTPTLFVDYHEKARYPFLRIQEKPDKDNQDMMIYSISEMAPI